MAPISGRKSLDRRSGCAGDDDVLTPTKIDSNLTPTTTDEIFFAEFQIFSVSLHSAEINSPQLELSGAVRFPKIG